MNDLKFALRQIRKSPAFTLIAVITLALGIGLNTTIFSLINDLFLRGLPFKEPSRLVHLYGGDKARDLADIGVSAPRYQHYRDGQTLFDGLAGENFSAFTLTGSGDPVQIFGGRLTSNYFDVLGVGPILGRNFRPEEEEGADVALVTKNFWQKRLGSDPNVIGRSITLDGSTHTIIGVLPNMPVTWFGVNPIAEVWTTKPFQLPGFSYERMMRGTSFLRVIGRMKTGITLTHVNAALPSLDQSYRTQYPNKIDAALTTTVRTLPQDVTQNFRAGFITLFAAVCLVWPPARDRTAHGHWCLAGERGETLRVRKLARECDCRCCRRLCRLAPGAGRSENGIEFFAAGSERGDKLIASGAHVHHRVVDPDRIADGNLPGASGITCRSG